jgi:hypothetical protein
MKLTCLILTLLFPFFANAKTYVQNAEDFVTTIEENVGFDLDAQDDFQANLENICTGKDLDEAMNGIVGIQNKMSYGDTPSLEGYEIIFMEKDVVRVRILRQFDHAVSNAEVKIESLICP